MAGTLAFGPDAEISVADAAAFRKKRKTYVNGYVLAEAQAIEGAPKTADALAQLGWEVVLNEAKTQVLLVRNRGLVWIIR